MDEIKNTRLRFMSSKSPADISEAINILPFKVEIKGGPIFDGKKWFVWFVIPDVVKEFVNLEL